MARMCELVKQVGQEAASRMVQTADAQPCLQSCSAEAIPIIVSEQAAVAALLSGRVIR